MADLGSSIKGIWLKGMEAIGNTASNIATNTKSKVDEMNLVNRRAEILKDFGNKAYALWLKGEQFPDELADQLKELEKLDEHLNDLRAERLAGVKTKTSAEEESKEEDGAAAENEDAAVSEEEASAADEADEAEDLEEEEDNEADQAIPVIQVETPDEESRPSAGLSDAINELFDKLPSADEAAEKVNSALDSLADGLKQFSDSVDEQVEDLADKIDPD